MSNNVNENNFSAEYLELLKSEVESLSHVINDSSIENNPEKIIDIVRKKLTEQMTKKARIKSVREDILKINNNSQIKTLEEIKGDVQMKKTMLDNRNKEFNEIQTNLQILEKELEDANEKHVKYSNILSQLSSIEQLSRELSKVEDEGKELEQEERDLNQEIDSNKVNDLKSELDEEKSKRLNIQKALDSLKAEDDKRVKARQFYVNDKKETLTNQINQIDNRKNELVKKHEYIENLKSEISRFKTLIARHKRRKGIFEEEIKIEPVKINKPRIGRLIMLLLTDGPNESVIKNLGEELNWSETQRNNFFLLAKEQSDDGIGALWANWLEELSKN